MAWGTLGGPSHRRPWCGAPSLRGAQTGQASLGRRPPATGIPAPQRPTRVRIHPMFDPATWNPTLSVLLNLAVALALGAYLVHQQRRGATFSVRVFTGLALGVVLGAALHGLYATQPSTVAVITETNVYLDIVGTGYVKLLQMIVMPADPGVHRRRHPETERRAGAGQDQRADHRHVAGHHAGGRLHRCADGQAVRADGRGPDSQRRRSGAWHLPARRAARRPCAERAQPAAELHPRQPVPGPDRRAQDLHHRGGGVRGPGGHRGHGHRQEEAAAVHQLRELRRSRASLGDAPGGPGAATDALRRVRADGHGGGRLQLRRHPETHQLRGRVLRRPGADVRRAPGAGRGLRPEPAALCGEDLSGAGVCLHVTIEHGARFR